MNVLASIETADEREERVLNGWAETGTVDHIADQDVVWFIAYAADWPDLFMHVAGWDEWPREIEAYPNRMIDYLDGGYPHSMWDEPMPTMDAIARLDLQHRSAERWAEREPGPNSLRTERNLRLALSGLRARYARTGDERMGW